MDSYLYQNCNYSYINANYKRQRNLEIAPTRNTPRVEFIPEGEYFLIEGRSCPENAPEFYSLILRNLYFYRKTGKRKLSVNVNFEYFNTSSAKCLYNLFKVLAVLRQRRILVLINWFYEDTDLLEAGQDYATFFDLNFNLIPVNLGTKEAFEKN